ncbi:hypothetical protein [Nocardia sp. NPDC005825]|uniref:hypothetical protein n=1 Tax=unclassified Nocardia TaxID=2637762 RepID=UPI0033FD96BE
MKTPMLLGSSVIDQFPLAAFVLVAAMLFISILTVVGVIFVAIAHPKPAQRRSAQRVLTMIVDVIKAILQ